MWILKFTLQPPEALPLTICPLCISAWLVVKDNKVLSGPFTTVCFGFCGGAVYFACLLPFLPHDTLVTGVFNASPFLTVLKCVPSRKSSPLGTNWWGSFHGHLPGFPIGHRGELGTQTCLPPDVGKQEGHPLLLRGPLRHITLSCEGRDS